MSADAALRARFPGYSGVRPDVLRLISHPPRRVLDVGCGAGLLGRDLALRYPDAEIVGIEPDAQLSGWARAHMASVVIGRVDDEKTLASIDRQAPFDLIVCADVLEHMPEPLGVLQRLVARLEKGGSLITSIPNVRHISTFISLGCLGTWPARSRGIHDRGHLRFFARRDILALGEAAGLQMMVEHRNLRLLEGSAWSMVPAMLLDFWPFRSFLTFQYLHLWTRAGSDR